ncbi:group III truncated hemoglobin [Sphingomonas sp. LM7]|uniref:group III truncated hemoglobin n=1 Tax=Sphingomonas sp. LM7 TaxID=1938607 RepID=UPI0009839368|nr:group III truncated hemoglobin [Sphingomonas sp. LM7]AQR74853.1 preprotein translocase subunit TatC [Sphingomonas sp. LM7]
MTTPRLTEDDLTRVVDTFYDRVRVDALLGPIFNGAIDDWPAHLAKLQAFWSSVMLTSGRYKGQPMPAHVRHEALITPATFERWLALWRATTEELLPPEAAAALQEKAARIAESLSLGIEFYRDRARATQAPAG